MSISFKMIWCIHGYSHHIVGTQGDNKTLKLNSNLLTKSCDKKTDVYTICVCMLCSALSQTGTTNKNSVYIIN